MKYLTNSGRYLVVLAIAAIAVTFGCQREQKNVKNVEVKKMVQLETTKGSIFIEVNETAAPITSANFLKYVEEGFYDGTIFHRVIPNFMIQGGGFTPDMNQKPTYEPIKNESSNGLKNLRGTIAMARTNNPDSATAQFFINVVDNNNLNDAGPGRPGYAVFGKVVEGMNVVDAIVNAQTTVKAGFRDVPAEPVIIKSGKIIFVRSDKPGK